MRKAIIPAILILAMFAAACGDADTKDNVATNNSDVDAGNVDAGNSTTPDQDAGTDPFGTVCEGPGGELAAQDCSVVDQDCEDGACEKRIILDDMQMPSAFAVVCGGDIITTELAEGDVCGVGIGECPNNMVCKRFAGEADSTCRKWCRLEDAYGCDPEQACVTSSDLEPVFGVCADACP